MSGAPTAAAPAAGRGALAGAFALAAGFAALDQASKLWIVGRLSPLDSITVIPGWLSLIFSTNEGVVFGFASSGPLRPLATLALPVLLVPLIAWLLWTAARTVERMAYALILGGAVGNLIDRFRLGHVIDFIDAYWRRAPGLEHHWYTFNLADSFICIGGGFLAYAWITAKPEPAKAPGGSDSK